MKTGKFKGAKAVLMAALAMLFLLGMLPSFTALADDITGNLVIHKYVMTDLTQSNDPNDGNTTTDIPDGATTLDGITFNVYLIALPTTGTDAGKVPVGDDVNVDSNTAPTTLTSGGVDFALTPAVVASRTTANGGIATFSNLPQGLYLVVEQPSDLVESASAPFIVEVPMTNPNGSGYLADTNVYPKNEDISVHKTADKTAVTLGGTVNWTVQATVPSDIANAKAFSVTDQLDPALDFTANTVVVTGIKGDSTTATIDPSNYTVTNPDPTAGTGNGNTLTVNFKAPTGLTALAAYKSVKISFATTTNATILNYVSYTLDNQATVNYTNRFDHSIQRKTEKPEVHTGAVIINKTDAKTGQGINVNNAEFQIASTSARALAGEFLRKTADGRIVDVDDADYATANPWIETTAGGTVSAPATATFQGLQDYTEDAAGAKTYLSYYVMETKAPTGYTLLAAPATATFTALNSTAATSYTISVDVKDNAGFILPRTGGIGTILFTAGGVVLIGAAVILLAMGSRRKKKKGE